MWFDSNHEVKAKRWCHSPHFSYCMILTPKEEIIFFIKIRTSVVWWAYVLLSWPHVRKKCIKNPIHSRDFPPGACSRGTLREQSSSVCTNDFMGILHPREQNFHPAKCSTIFNRLNIWEQAPGANWANLKTLPRVYWHVQNELGACSGSKTLRVYRPLCRPGAAYSANRCIMFTLIC